MFEKLAKTLRESLGKAPPPFDPALFGDPLAAQTAWTPLKGGGASFRTHKLAPASAGRLEFRATAGARLFYLLFLVAGLAVAIGIPAGEYFKGTFSFGSDLLFPLLFGLLFASAGGGLLVVGTRPIIFDKVRGFYWKGRKAPYALPNAAHHKHAARLGDIHALQLLAEHCRGKNSSYYSYELNLVLNNGQRLNVVDHGNRETLRADAAVLSRFLGKPVWDAT